MVISSRTPWVVEKLAAEFKPHGPVRPSTHIALKGFAFDLVINASPAGMRAGDPLAVDCARLDPSAIVADVVIHRVHIRLPEVLRPRFHVAADFLQLLLVAGSPAHQVDRPVLRGGHQPCAGAVRHALRRPLLERDHQGVLR